MKETDSEMTRPGYLIMRLVLTALGNRVCQLLIRLYAPIAPLICVIAITDEVIVQALPKVMKVLGRPFGNVM